MPEALVLGRQDDALTIALAGVELARYVFRPDAPASEAPKPFLAPLRSTSGTPMSISRPWDHRWHNGLQMTWSHVSGQNFWGGPTFSADEGYQWRDNLGSIEHREFTSAAVVGDEVVVAERLEWVTSAGERWIDERREQRFHVPTAEPGCWVVDFATTLTNIHDADLHFGSPTTHGRELAGYAGYFWRGPRAWTGAAIIGPGGLEGDALMGAATEWIAVAGQHDEVDGGGTVLAFAGSSSAEGPVQWFVRSEPFACIAPSPSFDQEIVLAPGGELQLRHRYVFVDRIADRHEAERLARELAL